MTNSDKKRRSLKARIKEGLFPVCAGVALFLTYPTLVAHQDMASLAKAGSSVVSNVRWLVSLSEEPGVSKLVTGSISRPAAAENVPLNVSFTGDAIAANLGDRLTSEVRWCEGLQLKYSACCSGA